jgi:mitochondrial transcription factor 1
VSGVSARLEGRQLNATTPIAQELQDTQIWKTARTEGSAVKARSQLPKVKGDKTRVNIVSEKLCDDILSYAGKSLERHRGCDLIDIYPGAGLWSRKLHEFLQPRSHILMEPDSALYTPFLQPLLDKPGTKLVPKSGIVWRDLNTVLTPEYLPHQKIVDPKSDEANKRNDTLLVTCNLTFHPKRRFKKFDSIASLVLHQLVDSIKTSTLFQKYGQVRLLIWARRDDKAGLLPRCVQRQRRAAVMNQLYCDWIHELVGYEGRDNLIFTRDSTIDRASALATFKRMKAEKISVPAGRESEALKLAKKDSKSSRKVIPGLQPPVVDRAYLGVLESLKETNALASLDTQSEEYYTMRKYTWRQNYDTKKTELLHSIQQDLDVLAVRRQRLQEDKGEDEKELQLSEQAVDDKITRLKQSVLSDFMTIKDNLHLWRQEKPVLHWDRRAVEPLIASTEEFFPNVESVLLDIQPGPVHPLFRQTGPNSKRAGDSFDLITTALWAQSGQPISKTLDAVWPGAADYIIPRCHSFRDPTKGGINVETSHTHLTPRLMNPRQWEELIERWMEWPFRPEFHELIARSQDEQDVDEGDGIPE